MICVAIYGINIVRMGSKHENTGRFAPVRKRETLEKTIIFLLTKQFVQKNKCNLCKKTIFLYRIAVALRMECVDLSAIWMHDVIDKDVALRMECVDLSSERLCSAIGRYQSHSAWSAWI